MYALFIEQHVQYVYFNTKTIKKAWRYIFLGCFLLLYLKPHEVRFQFLFFIYVHYEKIEIECIMLFCI